jgi:protein-disulfide isomerase
VRKLTLFVIVGAIVALAAGYAIYSSQRKAGTVAPAETAADDASATPEAAATQAGAGDAPALYDDDKILGVAEAPVTIIEYASLTCPHCANFHKNTLPKVKEAYVDRGLVRLVYRDFPLNKPALEAAVIAHCMPAERYFAMLDVLYASQNEWASQPDPKAALVQIARTAGLDQAKIDACLADQSLADRIIAREQEAQQKYAIESTPSFIIGGKTIAGDRSFESFEALIKEQLP